MSNPWVVAAVTVALIAASAFFVAVEFALLAARRHRLEDAASTSRSARAALRSASELSVLLAGSQLGITVCTLALGAITKPAVHHWLTPMFTSWGAPHWVSDAAGFALALLIVTFLHLVIGEMAPKSWAIAHPEKSATALAIPMRGFMWLTRPLITVLNRAANWCLVKVGVEPVDQVGSGQDTAALRHLVEHSASSGTLDEHHRATLASALELEALKVGDLVRPNTHPTAVDADATGEQIRDAADRGGHLRLLVRDDEDVVGIVHARDSLGAPAGTRARDLMREPLVFTTATPVYEAFTIMRDTRGHLAVVRDADGALVGLVTLTDIVRRLMPVPG